MTKRKKSNKYNFLPYFGIIFVFLVVTFTVCYFYGPRPSGRYFSSVIDKIGAPSGYRVSTNRVVDDLLEQKYARRTYVGNGDPVKIKQDMAERFKKAGFKNVSFSSPSGVDGVYAVCKGASVFARIYQKGDDPIDIEVFATNYPDTPRCPWIL